MGKNIKQEKILKKNTEIKIKNIILKSKKKVVCYVIFQIK
jgi:hypothetical protein